jgi:hypothetical protein
MPTEALVIQQTKKWILDVVIGCNFCPFAAREVTRNTVKYQVLEAADKQKVLETLGMLFDELKQNDSIETALLILPSGFASFSVYLQLCTIAEALLEEEGHEGFFQLASFHPTYLFAGSNNDDPSNYTNRSPYPMLHILREDSVSKAIDSYPSIGQVPELNIEFTKMKGLAYMQALRASCLESI